MGLHGGPKGKYETCQPGVGGRNGPELGRRGWLLLFESRTSLPKGEETVGVRENARSLGNVRRGLGDVGTGLRICWGVGVELVHEMSLAGCRCVRWRTDLLRKGRWKGGGRWLVLHSFLARLEQLINAVLNNVVAALNAQSSNVGHKEQTSFLLGWLNQHTDEACSRGHERQDQYLHRYACCTE